MNHIKIPIPPQVDLIAREIVDAGFKVHSALGPGLLESVYEICLAHELTKKGINFVRQPALPVLYDNIRLESGLRPDLIVEESIIIELKTVEAILPIHISQLLTYLKLSGLRLGLLINFNVTRIKDGIKRIVL
ncbi:MAG: GxxExxY protein [Deltaproteobacteria bacterium]|nr:GxxExxY protein [Deltaproteobacteria bacterium]